jgi:hypothetical protein
LNILKKRGKNPGVCQAVLDESAINLAVVAHVRHTMTDYDELLSRGKDRFEARSSVSEKVGQIVDAWRGAAAT